MLSVLVVAVRKVHNKVVDEIYFAALKYVTELFHEVTEEELH